MESYLISTETQSLYQSDQIDTGRPLGQEFVFLLFFFYSHIFHSIQTSENEASAKRSFLSQTSLPFTDVSNGVHQIKNTPV